MNRIIMLLMGCLLGYGTVFSQITSSKPPVSVRTWEEGKLTWDDFKLSPAKEGKSSHLEYFIWNQLEKSRIDTQSAGNVRFKNATVYRPRMYACVDTDSSWVVPAFRNEAQLRYNQTLFDIFALEVRKAQLELDGGNVKSQSYDSLFSRVMDSAFVRAEQYSNASDFGNDLGVTSMWETALRTQMALLPDDLPGFSERRFGIGAHAGLSGDLFTGSLGAHFTPLLGVTLGVDFALGRSLLMCNGNVDIVRMRKTYTGHQTWSTGNAYELFQGDIDYGFILRDGFSFRWTPFVGVGLSELSNVNSNEGEDRLKMSTMVWKAGLCVDYKLLNNLNLASKDLQYISLQAKCYVSYANYYDDLSGLTVNLSLSAAIFDRFIRTVR